jgi:hypothetical protein
MTLCGRLQILAGALLAAVASGALARPSAPPAPPAIRLIGINTIPQDASLDGTTIGGLSGIDYDPHTGDWYAISDDKSEHGVARFYRMRIDYDHDRPPVVTMLGATPLRNEQGETFPAPGTGREASDAESIRVVPGRDQLIWSSEGDARDGFGPAVRRMVGDGAPQGRLPLPGSLDFDPSGQQGPRPNLSIEGLSFTDRGRRLWLSLEAPLHQDGDLSRATTGAMVRFTQLAYPSGKLIRQLAYPVEPIGPYPPDRLADNGVSEILALDHKHLLVIERSGVQDEDGDFRFRSRAYCARTAGATNVSAFPSLRDRAYRPMQKTFAIDFSILGNKNIGNVEGVTLGPTLSNGNSSLVFITDNDFSPRRATQIVVLEISTDRHSRNVHNRICNFK